MHKYIQYAGVYRYIRLSYTHTNHQLKRMHKCMCDMAIHTLTCIFYTCGFEYGCVGYAHAHLSI